MKFIILILSYCDVDKQQITASGGDGYINILERENTISYKKIADIPERFSTRTSLLIPSLQLFVAVERAGNDSKAALVLYKMKDQILVKFNAFILITV